MGSLRRTATLTAALVAGVASFAIGPAARGAVGTGKAFDYTPKSGKPFDTVAVSGGGCQEKQVVTIRLVHDESKALDGQLDLDTTSTGTFSGSFGIKAGARNGPHTITARCGPAGSTTPDFVGDGPLPVSGGTEATTSTTAAAPTTTTVAATTTTVATVETTTTTTASVTTTIAFTNLNGTPSTTTTSTTAVPTTLGGPAPTLGALADPGGADDPVVIRKDDGGIGPIAVVAAVLGALVLVAGAAVGVRSLRRG